MLVHRAWADVEDIADLPIGFSAADPQQHWCLPRRQRQALLYPHFVTSARIGELTDELVQRLTV
jgi:hypothetical protein